MEGKKKMSAVPFLTGPIKKNRYCRAAFAAAIFAAFFISQAVFGTEPAPSYRLQDAGEKGVAPSGEAKGTVTSTFDEFMKKDVWDFSYTLAQDSSVSVWAKDFPAELAAASVTLIRADIKVPEAGDDRGKT